MKKPPLHIGEFQIYWLNGGSFRLDGGTMFGAVPKVLWEKRCLPAPDNTLLFTNDVLLIKAAQHALIVDTGLGNKLTEKQLAIFQVDSPWSIVDDLAKIGLAREDIDYVLLTHCDFDHAGGIVMHNAQGEEELSFPKATHIVQKNEWEDVEHPCRRAQSTYWPENFSCLKRKGHITLIDGDQEVFPGIRLRLTGGHTRGHQLIEISSQGTTAVHLGDLFPTHIHSNPLWIMAYDNFPLEVIDKKEQYLKEYQKKNSWFTFYHDPVVKACTLNSKGHPDQIWSLAAE